MEQFEYCVVVEDHREAIEAELNRLGSDGWEAYAAGTNGRWWAAMKRRRGHDVLRKVTRPIVSLTGTSRA